MSLIIFKNQVDLINTPTPDYGVFYVGYDEATGILSQKDYNGIITPFLGGSGISNLTQTLAQGNHTGTHSIILDYGSSIKSNTSNAQLKLDNDIILSTDSLNKSYLFMNSSGITLKSLSKSLIFSDKVELQYNSNNVIRLNNNEYSISLNGFKVLEIGESIVQIPGNRLSSILSSNGSSILAGISNSVVIGGTGQSANQSNTVYVPDLRIQSGKVIKGSLGTAYIKFDDNNGAYLQGLYHIGLLPSINSIMTSGISIRDTSSNSSTSNVDSGITYISSKNATNDSGLKNTIVIGGENINASKNNTTYIGGTVSINDSYVIPNDDGLNKQIFQTDGNGVVKWVDNIKSTSELINSGSNGVPFITDVEWDEIQGDQTDINLNGFTDGEDITLKSFILTSLGRTYLACCYGFGLYVLVANNGVGNGILTSTDGVNWMERTAIIKNWKSIIYAEGIFVVVGESDTVLTSYDGVTWIENPCIDGYWRSISYGNGKFVAVGGISTSTNRVMISDDGISWSAETLGASQQEWQSITFGNGRFVAVAKNLTDRIAYSIDALIWNYPTSLNKDYTSICYGNGKFVATGVIGSSIVISEDSIVWVVISIPITPYSWESISYGMGLFVAVNYTSSTSNKVLTSKDGVSWKIFTTPHSYLWTYINYCKDNFITLSTDNKSMLMNINLEQRFENFVNEYQLNGVKIEPINKVLNIIVSAGGGFSNFVFEQSTSSLLWVITHSLIKKPTVIVIDTAGTTINGQVDYINDNQLSIEFNSPISGKAYLQ